MGFERCEEEVTKNHNFLTKNDFILNYIQIGKEKIFNFPS